VAKLQVAGLLGSFRLPLPSELKFNHYQELNT